MTPKEKAEEIWQKAYDTDLHNKTPNDRVKRICLMTVNEIINANPHSNPFNTDVHSTMEYWQEVKLEIQKV